MMHNIRCLLGDPSMLSNPKDMLACLLFRLTFSSSGFFFFFSHAPKYNYKPTFKLQSHNVCVLACVCVLPLRVRSHLPLFTQMRSSHFNGNWCDLEFWVRTNYFTKHISQHIHVGHSNCCIHEQKAAVRKWLLTTDNDMQLTLNQTLIQGLVPYPYIHIVSTCSYLILFSIIITV